MLKIGVWGAGHLGKIHIQQLKNIQTVQLVGVYDTDNQRLKTVETELNVNTYTNSSQLMEQCDAIDIVTPTTTHFEIAQQAIRNGKHVFIEKPMTHTLQEAQQLVTMINEANVKCQIGHVERFNPAFLVLKDKEINPLFIEVHRLAQFNPRGTDVSVILDLMIHDLDIVLSMVKSDIKRISASGVNVISENPDIANARIEFTNGCVANITASRISLKKMRKIRLFQKEAYISIDFLEKKTEIVQIKNDTAQNGFLDFPIELPDGKKKVIAVDLPEIKEVNSIKLELEYFRDSILNNTPTAVTAEQGYLAMDVAYQILKKINPVV